MTLHTQDYTALRAAISESQDNGVDIAVDQHPISVMLNNAVNDSNTLEDLESFFRYAISQLVKARNAAILCAETNGIIN